jgi:hypothetical protein
MCHIHMEIVEREGRGGGAQVVKSVKNQIIITSDYTYEQWSPTKEAH